MLYYIYLYYIMYTLFIINVCVCECISVCARVFVHMILIYLNNFKTDLCMSEIKHIEIYLYIYTYICICILYITLFVHFVI